MTTSAGEAAHPVGGEGLRGPGAGGGAASDRPFASSDSLFFGPAAILWATLFAFVTYGLPLVIGATFDPVFLGVLIVSLVVGLSALFFLLDPRLYLVYWFSLVLVQNVSSGLWWSGGSGDIPLMVTEAKTISLLVGIVLCAPSILDLVWRNKLLVAGLSLYVFGIAWNLKTFDVAALANLRNFLTPFAVLLFGAAVARRYAPPARARFLVVMLGTASFWLVLGSAGEFLVGTLTWRETFSAEALGSLNSLSTSTTLLGITFDRIGGILIEPTTTGYLAASAILVLLLQRYFQGYRTPQIVFVLMISVCLLCLILSSTKNPLLMFAVGLLVAVMLRPLNVRPWITMVTAWVVAFVATLLYIVGVTGPSYLTSVWSDPLNSIGGDSTSVHMAGLISGFAGLLENPWGYGVGSGGNFLRIVDPDFSWTDWLLSGGESSWGTLAYQLGIFAVIGFAVSLIALGNQWGSSATILLAVWSSASLFAEAFFGPIVCSIILFSVGFVAELPRPDVRRPVPVPTGDRIDGETVDGRQ